MRTTKAGDNAGRKFFSCTKKQDEGCGFFQWEDEPNGGGGKATSTSFFGPCLAHFSALHHPRTRRVAYSTSHPCLIGTDWCWQSDGVTDSRIQAAAAAGAATMMPRVR